MGCGSSKKKQPEPKKAPPPQKVVPPPQQQAPQQRPAPPRQAPPPAAAPPAAALQTPAPKLHVKPTGVEVEHADGSRVVMGHGGQSRVISSSGEEILVSSGQLVGGTAPSIAAGSVCSGGPPQLATVPPPPPQSVCSHRGGHPQMPPQMPISCQCCGPHAGHAVHTVVHHGHQMHAQPPSTPTCGHHHRAQMQSHHHPSPHDYPHRGMTLHHHHHQSNARSAPPPCAHRSYTTTAPYASRPTYGGGSPNTLRGVPVVVPLR